ncbi:MAG TPA: hypothetical protein VKV26_01940 [Dehalococcoidia bacterium]|nr:hypothetical protein [Dehalococcoidia bacterium]
MMKRLSAVLMVGAAMVVLGLVQHAPAWADQVTNTTTPVSGTVTNPCNGENVTYSGQQHLLISMTINGNTAHIVEHVNVQASGAGDLGNQYAITATENVSENVDIDPTTATGEVTEVINEQFASQGGAPNFLVQELVHLTVNADGTITAQIGNATAECQG